MLAFWIAAALLCAAAVSVVLARAAKPAAAAGEEPELAVLRGHLAELEDARAQGLLDEAGYAAARAEAGRRLLAADAKVKSRDKAVGAARDPRRERLAVLTVAVAAVLIAMGAYLAVGSPGRPDQPYQSRLRRWLSADPASLGPGELAARLKYVTTKRPNDPRAWFFLGYSYRAAGDAVDASQAFEKSLALDPKQADAWSGLGESLTAMNDGQIDADARQAFEKALKLDPQSPAAQVYLGQAEIQAGNVEAGLAHWRNLAASLPANDPRRQELARRIAEVAKQGAPAPIPAGQAPMIRAMVERQAQALKANPTDVDGWTRLVRSYTVLHDEAARAGALKRAREIFKNRPADLDRIENAAASAP